jgi:ketosteroid isomerase-like protein
MSEENVEIVKQMYEAYHGGDAEGALAYFDPEVIVDASRRLDGGTGQGREYLTRIITSWVGTFEEFREEIEEMRHRGDRVFVAIRQRGRGKGSGAEVENLYALIYEIRAGNITRMTLYNDEAEALKAAGLSE